jgi:hypothetical protein
MPSGDREGNLRTDFQPHSASPNEVPLLNGALIENFIKFPRNRLTKYSTSFSEMLDELPSSAIRPAGRHLY